MKVQIASDIHVDYNDIHDITSVIKKAADVLILAGDLSNNITVSLKCVEYLEKLGYEKIIFVPGNHEYYLRPIEEGKQEIQEYNKTHTKSVCLDNEGIQINGHWIFGTTMWSGFRKGDPLAVVGAQSIADFRYIRKSKKSAHCINTTDMMALFKTCYHETELFLLEHKKATVISHFVPVRAVIHPLFRTKEGETTNPYFCSDVDQLASMAGSWIFGHSHNPMNLKYLDCNFITNPFGLEYHPSENLEYKPDFVVEI